MMAQSTTPKAGIEEIRKYWNEWRCRWRNKTY